ncbi:MAG TPA: 3-dehydroquinate synthase [Aggregatilineales bacterium]|nr:3-dehydroquinate synthase [Aggregatilineales bacterium]
MKPSQLLVNAPDRQYPIIVEDHALAALPVYLAERGLSGKVAVVTNETIAPLYGEAVVASLRNAVLVTLPDGESYKTLDSIRLLYDAFFKAELDRNSIIIGLGGGVIGDMAGFAAATFLRGVRFVQAPTSLLAVVDSSIGGKVGVDVPQGKNLIGAFKQPEMVVVDTSVLATLPDVEWRCGVAEAVKAGLIRDTRLMDVGLYRRGETAFIPWAIAFKVAIVQEDPYENGPRAFLNLGHTFGHALEQVSGFKWRHGEAVALGLLAAARLSQLHGLCDMNLPRQVEQMLRALDLPVRYRDYKPADIRAAMGTDKKRAGGKVRFVLLHAPGDPVLCDDVPDRKVLDVLESLRE